MSAAANGCRVLGEAVEYSDLHRILRHTAQDLAVSRETIDAVAGIQSGYSSKLLAPVPSKCLGQVSMGLLPGAWRTPFPCMGEGPEGGLCVFHFFFRALLVEACANRAISACAAAGARTLAPLMKYTRHNPVRTSIGEA